MSATWTRPTDRVAEEILHELPTRDSRFHIRFHDSGAMTLADVEGRIAGVRQLFFMTALGDMSPSIRSLAANEHIPELYSNYRRLARAMSDPLASPRLTRLTVLSPLDFWFVVPSGAGMYFAVRRALDLYGRWQDIRFKRAVADQADQDTRIRRAAADQAEIDVALRLIHSIAETGIGSESDQLGAVNSALPSDLNRELTGQGEAAATSLLEMDVFEQVPDEPSAADLKPPETS